MKPSVFEHAPTVRGADIGRRLRRTDDLVLGEERLPKAVPGERRGYCIDALIKPGGHE